METRNILAAVVCVALYYLTLCGAAWLRWRPDEPSLDERKRRMRKLGI